MSERSRLKQLEQQFARLQRQPRRERWPIPPAARAILAAFHARHPRFASMTRQQQRDAMSDDQLREDVCATTAAVVNSEGFADALAQL